jgi:hypothetical protein
MTGMMNMYNKIVNVGKTLEDNRFHSVLTILNMEKELFTRKKGKFIFKQKKA